MAQKKLMTKLKFTFEGQDEFPELDVDMSKVKTPIKDKDIKIINTKKQERDASCNKLF